MFYLTLKSRLSNQSLDNAESWRKEKEVRKAIMDLATIKLDVLTLGQYLQPSPEYAPIDRWATPEEFKLEKEALDFGIKVVESGPLVRSSYHADEQSRVSKNLA